MTRIAAAPPSTAEYLRFHALHQPRAVAVIEGGREIDYATFQRDLRKFTRALREFGLPRGSIVAVSCEAFYLHWQLVLACEGLGLVTASFMASEGAGLLPLLERARLVLSARDLPQAPGTRYHRLTPEWVAGVLASGEGPDDGPAASVLRPEEPQRIRRSSGSTGGFKMMFTTRAGEEHRMQASQMIMGFVPQSRLLISMTFAVGGMYSYANLCLRLGAACIAAGSDLARAIEVHGPSHVWLLPGQARAIVDQLSGDYVKPAGLTVILGGAQLTAALREKVLARLASRIVNTYNCNETGAVAAVDADGLFTLRPGVRAEVVDELGAPVPAGQLGEVRVRTACLVDGYIDNPEATGRMFRDGWFHTGDVGTMVAPRQLKLVGRNHELLNIGGLKFAPETIEEAVSRNVPLDDVGVTSRPDASGFEQVCIAVVLKDAAGARECSERIGASLPEGLGEVRILGVTRIPRLPDTGKIDRPQLKRLFSGK